EIGPKHRSGRIRRVSPNRPTNSYEHGFWPHRSATNHSTRSKGGNRLCHQAIQIGWTSSKIAALRRIREQIRQCSEHDNLVVSEGEVFDYSSSKTITSFVFFIMLPKNSLFLVTRNGVLSMY